MADKSGDTIPPPALWAQSKDKVFLTFEISDVKDPQINLTESTLTFRGTGGTAKKDYSNEITFFKPVNPQESKQSITQRQIYFEIKKKDTEESYWPRLTNKSVKHHWLKTDFNRWRDEDDSDAETNDGGMANDMNLEAMMNSMGGMGGGDFDANGEDSDDEDMPDLETTPSSTD